MRVLLLLLLLGAVQTARAQCQLQLDAPCICAPSIYEPVAIICENAESIDVVRRAISRASSLQIDSLTITGTRVQRLPARAFDGFTIIRLVLNNNGMTTIDDNAFDARLLDSLQELDLSRNNLNQIPSTGLPRLRNLRKLYLNDNGIGSIPAATFDSWASKNFLIKLELAKNRLTDSSLGFGGSAMQALINLEELSLESNAFTQVPSAALNAQRLPLINLNLGSNNITNVRPGSLDFPNLESLSLEYNGISTISASAFQQVPSLLYLYIGGNKFATWDPNMFLYIGKLRILGIGECPITTIPRDAFRNIPSLRRLEMSEAAVDTIEPGAFQMTPQIGAIIMNRNRLPRVPRSMFEGLSELYTIDLEANNLQTVDNFAWANLPSLQHLDIANNQLRVLEPNTFDNSFLPTLDSRVLYSCGNPWVCDERLEWFRQWLRQNRDIQIDQPQLQCIAGCAQPGSPFYIPDGWPLRDPDPVRPEQTTQTQPFVGEAGINVGWIILAVILSILLLSIILLAIIRYFISGRHRRQKQEEEDEAKIMASAASASAGQSVVGGYATAAPSVVGSQYPYVAQSVMYPVNTYATSGLDLDLPPATTLDERQPYWAY